MRARSAIKGIALAAILCASPVLACLCLPPAPSRAYDRATVVFSGVAESATQYDEMQHGSRRHQLQWHFKVGQVWKGPLSPVFNLDELGRSCEYSFVRGEHYVVYASLDGHRLYAHECSRTAPVERALVDRLALGRATVVNDSLRLPALTAAERTEAARELKEMEGESQEQQQADARRRNERGAYEQSWVRYSVGRNLPETVSSGSRRRSVR